MNEIEWEKRDRRDHDDSGKAIFKQENVQVPKGWSILATKIAVSNIFYGDIANARPAPARPRDLGPAAPSPGHPHHRRLGHRGRLLQVEAGREVFYNELTWLCVNQHGASTRRSGSTSGSTTSTASARRAQGQLFLQPHDRQDERAPTQYEYPQGSACFIQAVDDKHGVDHGPRRSEAMLFKFGSGTAPISPRSAHREKMSAADGPAAPLLLKVYDQIAIVVKSAARPAAPPR